MEIVFAKLARTHERSYEYLQTCRADACRGEYRIGQRTQRPAPRHREGQALRNLRNLDSANRGFSASGASYLLGLQAGYNYMSPSRSSVTAATFAGRRSIIRVS